MSLSYDKIMLRTGFSITADQPEYSESVWDLSWHISLLMNNFNRAGEKAWLLGFSYDFRDFIAAQSGFNFGRGV